MFIKPLFTKAARLAGRPSAALFLAGVFAANVHAQDPLNDEYPQLANLLHAFDVAQARLFEELVAINNDPDTRLARNQLELHLVEMANMAMQDMHGGGHGGHNMEMLSDGPYQEQETASRMQLISLVRGQHTAEQAQAAFENSGALDQHTAEVLRRGREFEARLFEIYIDDSVTNKERAVNAAVQDYLSDDRHAVASMPKNYALMASGPQATAFQTAFPRLSGLQWANQWATLAALEAIMVEYNDSQFRNTVPMVLERYWSKVGSDSGMTMFPAPSDLPMAATIAPHLYSFHPKASIIIDNLNMLETVVADALSYPNLDDREAALNVAVAEFTNKDSNLSPDYDYLLAALRGGIYNQGGPAVGELDRSERNRSRSAMNMQHTMIMSTPQ